MPELIDKNALLKDMGLTDAVKYGNKDAEQQTRSYSTWMSYEIADAIWDAPAVNRWIPCSERLPEQGQRVIAQFRYGKDTAISTARRTHSGSWIVDCMRYADKECVIIQAWMPLPDAYEPPESEVQDDDE